MMVTFISQCEKNALKKTRRVLDAFADRIGDNAWQTVITEDGLSTVKKMLRQTASKSTAVSCHWIRSRARSQLLWIVGNRSKFNAQGIVPVNRTQKLTGQFENDWHYLPLIKALAALAALLHDWGKATALFQAKLGKASRLGDPVRHEWISCMLLHALIVSSDAQNDDSRWLEKISQGKFDESELKELIRHREKKPLAKLPQAAQLVAWLIVSHHRLPNFSNYWDQTRREWLGVGASDINAVLKRLTQQWGYENRPEGQDFSDRLDACFEFPNGLMIQSSRWVKQLKKWAGRLQEYMPLIEQCFADGSYRLVLHHARLCLMLGDHYYSSQPADANWQDEIGLFANTDRKTKAFKQKLDEHLVGVSGHALRIAHLLPTFEQAPPVASDVTSLKQSSAGKYRWQDKAVRKINAWRKQHAKSCYGFFAVNMASTGCGKTFANAKIMRALSDSGESLRFILALGLRTLTLQTGDEYRNRIGLDDSELAVLIGSKAVMELHKQRVEEEVVQNDAQLGSESLEPLLDEDIDFDCDIPEEGLATVLTEQRDRQFLYAPVLACTIDHLMAATETRRGGRYILPCLRLISSDLVIDEVDDFTGSDLIAIGRLIHLAGMLGRKVMISSATIPPDLAEGYFNAYRAGWLLFALTRDTDKQVGCAWIDEFGTHVVSIGESQDKKAIDAYRDGHQQFIVKRVNRLKEQPAKRKAEIILCQVAMDNGEVDTGGSKQDRYFAIIRQSVIDKHSYYHTIDKKSGRKVSFGVVRVANINPCIAVAHYLMQCDWPEDVEVRVMAYHSQQVLLLRSEQEKHLDRVLKRKELPGDEPDAFNVPVIRRHIDQSKSNHLIFILAATPVEEIGRDHDFDWAVIEPSSYRSIIQLSGRVRRHRDGCIDQPNLALLQYNWKTIEAGNQPGKYFCRPGYEETQQLDTHDLCELIDIESIAQRLDATPRIQKCTPLNHRRSLADLEHMTTQVQLARYEGVGPETLQGYLIGSWYLTALPQLLNPFRKSEPQTKAFLMYDPDEERFLFVEKDDRGHPVNRENILQIFHQSLSENESKRLWLHRNYLQLLRQQAERRDSNEKSISLCYGELSFVQRENQQYGYSDQLGLFKLQKEEE